MSLESLKWYGTTLCLIGIALTSLNIYPWNIIFGFVGSGMWTIAGYKQDDKPLMLVEFVATAMYLGGIGLFIYTEVLKWK